MTCNQKQPASFKYGGNEITFQKIITQHNKPVRFNQALERSASGKLRTEKLGDPVLGHVITFTDMPQTDYDNLRNFLIGVVQGAQSKFTFTDEYGAAFLVYFIDTSFDFVQNRHREWTGSLSLEVA